MKGEGEESREVSMEFDELRWWLRKFVILIRVSRAREGERFVYLRSDISRNTSPSIAIQRLLPKFTL